MLPVMTPASVVPASKQDGMYPRPQLVRARWADLGGVWGFAHDDDDVGLTEGWYRQEHDFHHEIVVPFPPESAESKIGDTGYHPVVWYRRKLTAQDLADAGHRPGQILVLHLGAVDYHADVWADGQHLVSHEGGHTPFSVAIPEAREGLTIVVRAQDDPFDLSQPRGKQDWEPAPHVIWYDRSTGIWQPVWLESVSSQHVSHLTWRPDAPNAVVSLDLELAHQPTPGAAVRVRVALGDEHLATATFTLARDHDVVAVPIPALHNGQDHERFRWTPESPTLIDATVELLDPAGEVVDTVRSYFGFRTVGTEGGHFLLNGFPYQVRAVLEQGFWPQSHLAAPSADALRAEVEAIKSLGFNTARLHQKIEDPRFMFWADKLGLMVWAELPSTYEFSDTSVRRLTTEWLELLRRDASHPCVTTWVPFNESWGVGNMPANPAHRALTQALYHLTKAFDASRIVISNDGWEHTESDLLTVHDYENDAAVLAESYRDRDSALRALSGLSPNGRRIVVGEGDRSTLFAAPIMLSEFGGVSLDLNRATDSWGYRVVGSAEDLETQLDSLFQAVHSSTALAGWCYTQITDTQQETNGLLDENRVPKLPVETLRAMITGESGGAR